MKKKKSLGQFFKDMGAWHKVWFVVVIWSLLAMLVIPHYTVREKLRRFWRHNEERIDQRYRRNVSNIRSMRNYSKDDIERERVKRDYQKRKLSARRFKENDPRRRELLAEYYGMLLGMWLAWSFILYVAASLLQGLTNRVKKYYSG
jgi:ABC-type multidrug transport system fused ATPase/permease subunit